MQNMSGSQLRESFAFSRRNAVLFCAALLALACALVALAPGQAHAKSYTMPKVDIQAQVETDGALQVNEQRTFDFDGDFSGGVVDLRRASAERFPQDQRRAYGERRCRWHGGGRLDDVAERGVRARLARIGRAWERFLLVRRAEEQRCTCSSTPPTYRRIIELDYTGGQRGAGVFRHRRGVLEIRGLPMERGFRQRHHDVGAARTAGTEVVPGENVRAWVMDRSTAR